MSDTICVGTVSGAFGVQGEVRLKSFTADPEAIADYAPLTTEDGSRSFDIQLTRAVKGGFAARLFWEAPGLGRQLVSEDDA